MQSNKIDVEGTELEYVWIGNKSSENPVLVFLHHGLGCVESWKDFPEKLCELTGCPGLVYSRSGYGNSSGVESTWDREYLHHEARVVLPQVIDHLGVKEHIVVGHSDGASIALIYAATNSSRTLNTLMGIVSEAAHVFVEEETTRGVAETVEAYRNGRMRESLSRYHGTNTDLVFNRWAETWLSDWFRDWNIVSYLEDIEVPVLAIQGANDPYGTGEQIQIIRDNVKETVATCLFESCGHVPHREKEQEVLSCIKEFIDSILRK